MIAGEEALCLFLSPRADDARGDIAHHLREAGVHLWVWPLDSPEGEARPPEAFDGLIVLDGEGGLPPALAQRWIGVLRLAWQRGAAIGLFGSAVELLATADIAPAGLPVETAGLFADRQPPGPGTLDEFVEALRAGPHVER